MAFDIVRKPKQTEAKPSVEPLALKYKFFWMICLFSLTSIILPHETFASMVVSPASQTSENTLVFNSGSSDYQDYIDQVSGDFTNKYYQQQLQTQQLHQEHLTVAVKKYLQEQGSPLAEYANVLVTLHNWKKIVALANAESGMCEHYNVETANCWGVGGASLWDMGDNLGDSVVYMNNFLTLNPKRSKVKYSTMSFDDMNGVYKQPAGQHWVDNAQIVYDDLTQIENSVE